MRLSEAKFINTKTGKSGRTNFVTSSQCFPL